MNKTIVGIFLALTLISCDPKDLQKVLNTVNDSGALSQLDISNGLKEALQFGVDNSVNFLSVKDGFYKTAYKILLPDEAQKVVQFVDKLPLTGDLENTLLQKVNHAAEDAVSKAGPIFLDAIKGITFNDAKNILLGNNDAATQYLHSRTYNALYSEFRPVLDNSLNKVGVLDYYSDIISKYNALNIGKQLNPDLADHINTKALAAVFDLVEQKEQGIREDVGQRTTSLLQNVFAEQDDKVEGRSNNNTTVPTLRKRG